MPTRAVIKQSGVAMRGRAPDLAEEEAEATAAAAAVIFEDEVDEDACDMVVEDDCAGSVGV